MEFEIGNEFDDLIDQDFGDLLFNNSEILQNGNLIFGVQEFENEFPVDFHDETDSPTDCSIDHQYDGSDDHGYIQENFPHKKKSRSTQMMDCDEWKIGIENALEALKQIVPAEVTKIHLSVEASTRYSVKSTALGFFQIFPWFHAPGKFRQTLKTSSSQGPTIERVLEAINYFYQRRGEDYTEAELQFLRNYYQQMSIPIPSVCLSTIIDVYMEFKRFRGSHDRESTDAVTPDQFRQLEARVGILEGIVNSDSRPGTKRGRGGDRACWYPIRPCDLESRSEWCVPGGVFGYYSDGVGRLLPIDAVPVRRSIVVYSTDPDTVEAHPAPANPNHVLVVMVSLPSSAAPIPDLPLILSQVGEAPVKLRGDQYDKLKRWKDSVCDIYVNHLGEVCLNRFSKSPPHGGEVFAQMSWLPSYQTDSEGYPVFQGVRGVCAKINCSSSGVIHISRLGKLFHGASRSFRTLFVSPPTLPSEATLLGLMSERQALYGELAQILRQKASLKERHQQSNTVNTDPVVVTPVIAPVARVTISHLKIEKKNVKKELTRRKLLIKKKVKANNQAAM
jgi:hypothetical protein